VHEWNAWRSEYAARFLGLFEDQVASIEATAGDPSGEILKAAREHDSDVIVLVWREQLAVERADIVMAVLRGAPCPVLFLRTRPSLDLPPGVVEVRAPPLQ
jgi:nucleotide-binding universal stress UspA family protein